MGILTGVEKELQGLALWRRQRARDMMDCYALAMEALNAMWTGGRKAPREFEALARLMVEGMSGEISGGDENSFYSAASNLCRECAALCLGEPDELGAVRRRGSVFRIYAALFQELSGRDA